MATKTDRKLKTLLEEHIPGTVLLASWLDKKNISHDLQQYYRRSGWFESIGTGAFKRSKESVSWRGALFTLQSQANLPIHAGGPTAISMHGLDHYIRLGKETVYLFSSQQTALPAWFRQHDWSAKVEYIKTSILPADLGIGNFEENNFTIKVASPERAILECLYLSPDYHDLVECYQVFEGLTNLRPKLIQELLETCSSIKVKRLFFYMADKAKHEWLPFIDKSKISFGTGDRSIVKGGVYISPFRISIPKELAELL
jgi:hypothetical protein